MKERNNMAFDPFESTNKKMIDAVKHNPILTDKENDSKDEKKVFVVPKVDEEKTKTYTFTMRPGVRRKLSELSKSHGFKSDSSFLAFLIDHVE